MNYTPDQSTEALIREQFEAMKAEGGLPQVGIRERWEYRQVDWDSVAKRDAAVFARAWQAAHKLYASSEKLK